LESESFDAAPLRHFLPVPGPRRREKKDRVVANSPETELLAHLRQANRLLEELLGQCYGHAGIGTTRVDVLELLAGVLDCSQTLVARQLGLSESTVCTLIDRMQMDGLLARQRSATDRRRSVLAVSDLGQRLLHEATARRDQRLRHAFQGWTADTRAAATASLQDLIATLQRTVGETTAHPRAQERAA